MRLIILLQLIKLILAKIEFFTPFGMSKTKSIEYEIGESSTNSGSGQTILYLKRGGVMRGPVNVYLVFYGQNWTPSRTFKIQNFVKNMHSSSYFSIIKNYKDEVGNITGPLILKQSIWQSYEYGLNLDMSGIIKNLHNLYPRVDPQGIYAILSDNQTSISVSAQIELCKAFCGFHTIVGQRKIVVVGDASICGQCSPFRDSPSLDKKADAITNILAHEIIETLSNPDTSNPSYLNANNEENADICNFNMGKSNPVDARGNRYNVIVGHLKYYVQSYWSLLSSGCSMMD